MSLTLLRPYVPGTDGVFVQPSTVLEGIGCTRAMVTSDDGICQGYVHTDGRLWALALVTPNPGKIAADAATAAAAATVTTKANLATAVVLAQVARVRAIPLGSRTDQDKWLMALSFLLLSQE